MGKGKLMENKRFYTVGIIMGILSGVLGFFVLPVESIILSVVGIILSVKNKSRYRTTLAIVLCVIAAVFSAMFLAILFLTPDTTSSYWFTKIFNA